MIALLVVKALGSFVALGCAWGGANLFFLVHAMQEGIDPKAGKSPQNVKIAQGLKMMFHGARFLGSVAAAAILTAIWWPPA